MSLQQLHLTRRVLSAPWAAGLVTHEAHGGGWCFQIWLTPTKSHCWFMKCSVRPSALAWFFYSYGCGMTPSVVHHAWFSGGFHSPPAALGGPRVLDSAYSINLSSWSDHMQRDQHC